MILRVKFESNRGRIAEEIVCDGDPDTPSSAAKGSRRHKFDKYQKGWKCFWVRMPAENSQRSLRHRKHKNTMLETDKMQQTAGEFFRLNTDPHSIRSLLGQEG